MYKLALFQIPSVVKWKEWKERNRSVARRHPSGPSTYLAGGWPKIFKVRYHFPIGTRRNCQLPAGLRTLNNVTAPLERILEGTAAEVDGDCCAASGSRTWEMHTTEYICAQCSLLNALCVLIRMTTPESSAPCSSTTACSCTTPSLSMVAEHECEGPDADGTLGWLGQARETISPLALSRALTSNTPPAPHSSCLLETFYDDPNDFPRLGRHPALPQTWQCVSQELVTCTINQFATPIS